MLYIIIVFSVSSLFWFYSCQYLPSDWLERLLLGCIFLCRGDYLHRDLVKEHFLSFFGLVYCYIVCLFHLLHNIYHTSEARYILFVLKVPLNTTNEPTNQQSLLLLEQYYAQD